MKKVSLRKSRRLRDEALDLSYEIGKSTDHWTWRFDEDLDEDVRVREWAFEATQIWYNTKIFTSCMLEARGLRRRYSWLSDKDAIREIRRSYRRVQWLVGILKRVRRGMLNEPGKTTDLVSAHCKIEAGYRRWYKHCWY